MAHRLIEISDWVEAHGREPQPNGDLNEKMLFASLKKIRSEANNYSLKMFDRLNLLD